MNIEDWWAKHPYVSLHTAKRAFRDLVVQGYLKWRPGQHGKTRWSLGPRYFRQVRKMAYGKSIRMKNLAHARSQIPTDKGQIPTVGDQIPTVRGQIPTFSSIPLTPAYSKPATKEEVVVTSRVRRTLRVASTSSSKKNSAGSLRERSGHLEASPSSSESEAVVDQTEKRVAEIYAQADELAEKYYRRFHRRLYPAELEDWGTLWDWYHRTVESGKPLQFSGKQTSIPANGAKHLPAKDG